MKKVSTPIALIAALLIASHAPCLSEQEKPNVVLIVTDDQGYGDLGCTGNPVIQTPHMDALSAESSTLDDYHVAPTCSPTRAALLTGHWTNRTGVWHTIMGRSMLRSNEISLGKLLQDNGYQTGMFGKWHLGDNYPYRAEDHGFGEVYRHGGGGVGQTPDYWNNSYFDGHYLHNSQPVPAKGFCTDVFFEAGNTFIRQCVAEKKPFFAYIATNAPHGPLHCPQEYMDRYASQKPATAAFFGMITNIDDNVGKTRALLKELGAYQNTIFIFTTDNGTASGASVFNAGMRGAKGSEYDGGHRVPFFLHWPAGGMDKKHPIKNITHAVDIVPTILDLTGSSKPNKLKFDGTSLRALLDPTADPDWPDRMLVTDSQRVVDPVKWRKSAVMSQRWRLVNGVELYDIQADPGQKKNLSQKHPDQVKTMRTFYDKWWAEIEPTFSQTTEIYLGQPGHPKVTLTCHDWINGERYPPWNQGQVRRAGGLTDADMAKAKHPDHWAVKVITSGTYEISLLRWPEEAKHPISAPLPPSKNVPGASQAYRAKPGKAIPIHHAILRINGRELAQQSVSPQDTKVTFTTQLTAGSHQLSPVFITQQGGEVGAYYAVVKKMTTP
ncbi:MAG: arylsulfatase [Verrucomicrobiae bacterium]|nr:arylsulfatase [Verrucomicrobiae bacterium]NNJ42467.1 arylsulfatase [Akkermansiaceae bacterium]